MRWIRSEEKDDYGLGYCGAYKAVGRTRAVIGQLTLVRERWHWELLAREMGLEATRARGIGTGQ